MGGRRSGFAAERRVSGVVAEGARRALDSGLAPTDPQPLLVAVARARARGVTRPRSCNAGAGTAWCARRHATRGRSLGVKPRCGGCSRTGSPAWSCHRWRRLGTCSALAPVDQHRVVSTVRGSDVFSDPTDAPAVTSRCRIPSRAPRIGQAGQHLLQAATDLGMDMAGSATHPSEVSDGGNAGMTLLQFDRRASTTTMIF